MSDKAFNKLEPVFLHIVHNAETGEILHVHTQLRISSMPKPIAREKKDIYKFLSKEMTDLSPEIVTTKFIAEVLAEPHLFKISKAKKLIKVKPVKRT